MADHHTLFVNQTFTEATPGEWDSNPIVISGIVDNSNNAYNALDVTIQYENFVPDGENVRMGSVITAVVEEEIATGVWVPIIQQGREVKGADDAPNHIMVRGPQPVFDLAPTAITQGPRVVTWITRASGTLGEKVRVKLVKVVTDPNYAQHTSVTVSMYAREYDM